MEQKHADFLEKSRAVFIDNPGTSLLDVRKKVEGEPEGTARRDRLSAFSSIKERWDRPLALIPASNAGLIYLFRNRRGPELGIKRKRFQNIKSHITQAVRKYGAVAPSITSRIPPSAAWSNLLAKVIDKDYASALRRFACFCTVMGFAPDDDLGATTVLLGFYEALVAEMAVKNPKVTLRLTITYWNMQSRKVAGWPQIRLGSPFPSKAYIRPLAEFPDSFAADLSEWVKVQTKRRAFGESGPAKPKRPATIKYQTDTLRRFASLLVRENILRLDQITALDTLVDPVIARLGLEVLWKEAGENATGQLRSLAHLLRVVGKYYGKLPEEQAQQLSAHCSFLGRNARGLSKRNIDRLKQFDDTGNLINFLNYPYKLIENLHKRMKEQRPLNQHRQAKVYERAAAAVILIYSRVRMRNLHTIRIDTNLLSRGEHIILSYTEEETKNRRVLQLELPQEATKLLRTFIQRYRQYLPGSHSPFLFPGRDGGPRPASTMAQDFGQGMFRITGLRINPHLVRHIIGTVATTHDPGLVTAVSQALGHADFQTTLDFYLPNQSLASSRTINRLLETKVLEGLKSRGHGKRGQI